jgi:hypothetical protein
MFKLQISSIFNFDWADQSWISGVLDVKKTMDNGQDKFNEQVQLVIFERMQHVVLQES